MAEDPEDEVDIYRTITRRDNWGLAYSYIRVLPY
jgi:hypothetical protein